jgi:hypothetical protein
MARQRPGADSRPGVVALRSADNIARGAVQAREWPPFVQPAPVNSFAGVVAFDGDAPFAILAFTVTGRPIVSVDVFNDRELVPRMIRS